MEIPVAFAAPIFAVLSVALGKRGWDAIRDDYVGWGTDDNPVFIHRNRNPGAFWFFVWLFWLFCLGLAYGACVFTIAAISGA